ncbi:hypothetical protein N781_03240 [Pontibacillus halophilus JSM 076056 = DSM 19796]|uniref:ABC-2 type transporter transmembrane domain-containing protein n=1 Tax=Pontibacillus halophilus JSM 076056 = DSM 19796 TaxID=1385510 RepID=A0A0A5GJD1_9BACI|nr:ABC transporter permease [Pontibacillus halophilus]KGX92089.1 hypothetical protein N781_03240 [Pontibacillus halophilus JSM 076056 = DSM 19796]
MLTHILKDLRTYIKDKKALLITLLMPTILMVILGMSVGKLFMGNSNKIEPFTIALVNDSESATLDEQWISFVPEENRENLQQLTDTDFVQLFQDEVLENPEIQSIISYEKVTMDEAEQRLRDGDVAAIIFFSTQFQQDYVDRLLGFTQKDEPLQVEVVTGDNEIEASVTTSILESFTNELSKRLDARRMVEELATDEINTMEAMGPILSGIQSEEQKRSEIVKETIEGRTSITGIQYYTIGMAAMFMLYTTTFASTYVRDELRNQTMNRILIAGTSIWKILFSRYCSTVLIIFFQITILFTISRWVFGMSWTNPGLLLGITLLTALSTSVLAVIFSILTFQSPEKRNTIFFESVFIPFLAMIGGSFISRELLPGSIREFGSWILNGAALDGMVKVMQGYGLSELMLPIMALLLNGFVLVLVAYILIRVKGVKPL